MFSEYVEVIEAVALLVALEFFSCPVTGCPVVQLPSDQLPSDQLFEVKTEQPKTG
jgi:hypothetical protein